MNFAFFTFEYFLETMERNDIRRVEIWAGSPHLYAADDTREKVRDMHRALTARQMQVVDFCPEGLQYPYNAAAPEGMLRRRTREFYERNLDFAGELESPYLLVLAGRSDYDVPVQDAWKRSAEMLSQLADYAAHTGVKLLLEPLQYTEANLVTDLASLQKMLDEVNSPCLLPMLDTVQMTTAHDSIEAYAGAFCGGIRHVHLTEGNPAGHLPWGDGNLPLAAFLRAFAQTGYDGSLTMEIGGNPTVPREEFERGLRVVEKAISDL